VRAYGSDRQGDPRHDNESGGSCSCPNHVGSLRPVHG
jgi:hypothetical protein